MNAHRMILATVAWLCAAAGVLAFAGAPAQAKTVHVFAGSFGAEGTGPGQFKDPRGVAVNDTTHDVYVVDSLNNRVQEFNATGSTVIGEFNGAGSPTGCSPNQPRSRSIIRVSHRNRNSRGSRAARSTRPTVMCMSWTAVTV